MIRSLKVADNIPFEYDEDVTGGGVPAKTALLKIGYSLHIEFGITE